MKQIYYTKEQANKSLILVDRILNDLKSAPTQKLFNYHKNELNKLGIIILDEKKPSIVFPSQEQSEVFYYELNFSEIISYDFKNTTLNLQ